MCSICGIVDYKNKEQIRRDLLEKMGEVLVHRGPDQQEVYVDHKVAFQHNRLAIIDIENGLQPMKRIYNGNTYVIVYNGELYNTPELSKIIEEAGVHLQTRCDTEVVLYMYILFGEQCATYLNGIFAFAVWDTSKEQVYLARDRFGIKPLFYTMIGSTLLFASEVKGLLAHPQVKRILNQEGLWQLLYMAPTTINGKSVLKDIEEMPTGCYGIYQNEGWQIKPYWKLEAKPFTVSEEEAVYTTRMLLKDAIERQLVSDVPLATLLSGGLDSSIITSVAAKNYAAQGKQLTTYSFEYENNKKYFKSTLFQPQSDDDYAAALAMTLGTNHKILTVDLPSLVGLLEEATYARDLPGMADIDSSLLYYCRAIKQEHTVVLSGECADEIFGGYPWFYRKEMLEKDFFPWIHDAHQRADLFTFTKQKKDEGYAYMKEVYLKSVAECPVLDTDSPSMRQSRIATWLSVNYFMNALLERKDRMSMASGVEVRVPFSDHRILEYVYNVPWEIKFKGQSEKALLRAAMAEYLPDYYLKRKKSPYPKTHNPLYEQMVWKKLELILNNPNARLHEMVSKNQLNDLLQQQNITWFGQLMSRPQLMAWMLQLEFWLTHYDIKIEI
ncbi:MAG: asparagine synthase (glutamine-hydrolyzing) [Cellulosilyticum sp.]|nr:asparagine synthase (glutamine-hydrolyzing) [Cellulosilyticum sp.]